MQSREMIDIKGYFIRQNGESMFDNIYDSYDRLPWHCITFYIIPFLYLALIITYTYINKKFR